MQQLPLRSLARIEEDGLAVPPQQVSVVVALRRGHLASRAEHDELSCRGLATGRSMGASDGGATVMVPGSTSRAGWVRYRRSNTRRAGAVLEHVGEGLVDLLERARLADDPRASGGVELERLGQVDRVPTIEPVTVMPCRTVSKIGSAMRLSAGRPTKTESTAPAQRAVGLLERLRRGGQRDGRVGAAEGLDGLGRILGRRR